MKVMEHSRAKKTNSRMENQKHQLIKKAECQVESKSGQVIQLKTREL